MPWIRDDEESDELAEDATERDALLYLARQVKRLESTLLLVSLATVLLAIFVGLIVFGVAEVAVKPTS